jgi:arginine decarboxylase
MNGNQKLKVIQDSVLSSKKQLDLLVGNRIPKHFFITSGTGQSDITIHAGSFHLALKEAGIERCNIMLYSSIMPAIATKIDRPPLVHGSVMESIMAIANSEKNKRATAGIVTGWLFDKKTGSKYGGLVCEYNGTKTEEDAKTQLTMSLSELYKNGFSEDYELKDVEVITRSIIPKKRFGTAIVAICFTDYVYPVVGLSK